MLRDRSNLHQAEMVNQLLNSIDRVHRSFNNFVETLREDVVLQTISSSSFSISTTFSKIDGRRPRQEPRQISSSSVEYQKSLLNILSRIFHVTLLNARITRPERRREFYNAEGNRRRGENSRFDISSRRDFT